MWAIYKRELKAYFHSVIGFLFMGAIFAFLGLYFFVYNLYQGYPYFYYAFSGCTFAVLIAVPILTMRMMAEERKNKTDQLILTAPVSLWEIVIGKYLAALTVFAIPCAVSCVFPIILNSFGTTPIGENYLSVLGFFLYGCADIAIGLFISSLFESQIIAAVVSFVALFLGYMMPSICNLISSSGNVFTNILGFYDLYTPMSNLFGGLLDFTSIIYFISIIALFLFLTTQSVQKRRYSISAEHFSFGAYSVLGIVVAIAIMVFVNIGVKQIPTEYSQIDCTYNKMYTLTDQSKEYLKNLDKDVTIYVLYNEADYDTDINKLLARYESASSHVKVEYIDPTVNPRFYANYTSSAPSNGSIIVVCDSKSKVVDYSDLYEYEYSYYYGYQTTGFDAEGQLTSAIDYVTSENTSKIYITEGHGEYEFDDTYLSAINKANIDYETINLMNLEAVPEDAELLIINGPETDFSEDDVNKIIAYMDKGGKVMVNLSMTEYELTTFNEILEYMGIEMNQGLVVEDNANYYFYGSPTWCMPTISSTDYTSTIYGTSYQVLCPYATGIILPEEESDDITYDTIMSTSSSAYILEDYLNATELVKSDTDPEGPFPLGVSAVKSLTDEDGNSITATMVVYAAALTFSSKVDAYDSSAGMLLFTDTLGGLIESASNVSIAAKEYTLSTLTVSSSVSILVGVAVTILLPIILIVTGIVIWARRRKY